MERPLVRRRQNRNRFGLCDDSLPRLFRLGGGLLRSRLPDGLLRLRGCGLFYRIGKRDAGTAQERKDVLHKIIVGNAAAKHAQPMFAAVDDTVIIVVDPLRRIA